MTSRSRVFAAGLGLLVITPGCMARIDPQTQTRLDATLSAYQAGDDDQTVARAEGILADHPTGPAAMQARYLRGQALYRKGQYGPATEDLAEVARSARSDDLRRKALDTLGEIDFRRGLLDSARTRLEAAVEAQPPGRRPADHAHYRLGQIAQRQGLWDEADQHFQKVIYYFADSELASRARLLTGARAWTVQAGSFTDRDRAETAAEKLRKAGFEPTVYPTVRNGSLMFLLQVGRWDRYEQAETQRDAVRAVRPDAFRYPTR